MKSKIVELSFTKLSEQINIMLPPNPEMNNAFDRIAKELETCILEYKKLIPDKYNDRVVRIISFLILNRDVPLIKVKIKHQFRLSKTQQISSDYYINKIQGILSKWVLFAMHGENDEL